MATTPEKVGGVAAAVIVAAIGIGIAVAPGVPDEKDPAAEWYRAENERREAKRREMEASPAPHVTPTNPSDPAADWYRAENAKRLKTKDASHDQ